MAELQRATSGTRLSVTLPASFAEHWLTPSIAEFYRRHDEIDLRLDASNRDVDLLTEPFDLAIRYGRPVAAPLDEVLLFGDAVLPVCTPEFQRRHGIGEGRALQGAPLIHVDNRTSDPGWVGFEGWGAAFGFDAAELRQGVRYSRVSSGLKSALEGQGLVLSGLAESYEALRDGRLVAPFGPELRCRTEYAYRLVWARGRRRSALEADFVDWVLEKAERYRAGVAEMLGGPP